MDQKQYTTKTTIQKTYKTNLFPLVEKEKLTNIINLSGPPDLESKYTINQILNLHDP